VFTGDVTRGRIESRDPNSLDIVHAFDAYGGGLTGFEVHGHYVCKKVTKRQENHNEESVCSSL